MLKLNLSINAYLVTTSLPEYDFNECFLYKMSNKSLPALVLLINNN